jgi:hypothetical protein
VSQSNWFSFALLRYTIGLKKTCALSIVTRTHTFSRALGQLHVFTSSFDWFTGLPAPFVIGQRDYFGFGFTTRLKTALYWNAASELIIPN